MGPAAAPAQAQAPITLVSHVARMRSRSGSLARWEGHASMAMPALFTSTSSCPNAATVSATARSGWSGWVTSSSTAIASAPAAASCATGAAPSARRRTPSATLAPSAASRRAISRPMPRLPPVTSATRRPISLHPQPRSEAEDVGHATDRGRLVAVVVRVRRLIAAIDIHSVLHAEIRRRLQVVARTGRDVHDVLGVTAELFEHVLEGLHPRLVCLGCLGGENGMERCTELLRIAVHLRLGSVRKDHQAVLRGETSQALRYVRVWAPRGNGREDLLGVGLTVGRSSLGACAAECGVDHHIVRSPVAHHLVDAVHLEGVQERDRKSRRVGKECGARGTSKQYRRRRSGTSEKTGG